MPVREICEAARRKGVITVVDGAHMLGQIPMRISDLWAAITSPQARTNGCSPRRIGAALRSRGEPRPAVANDRHRQLG